MRSCLVFVDEWKELTCVSVLQLHPNMINKKQYAKLEEDFGLARHAMAIYDRCVGLLFWEGIVSSGMVWLSDVGEVDGLDVWHRSSTPPLCLILTPINRIDRKRHDSASQGVPEEKRYDMFLLYIKKVCIDGWVDKWMDEWDGVSTARSTHLSSLSRTTHTHQVEALYGVTRTREVYQKAIEALPDEGAKNMCLEYAEVERKLGEVRSSDFWSGLVWSGLVWSGLACVGVKW